MGDEILDTYPDAEVILEVGSGGQFDIALQHILLFSKDQVNRFPEPGEIVKLIGEIK